MRSLTVCACTAEDRIGKARSKIDLYGTHRDVKGSCSKAEAHGEQHRREAETAGKRVDHLPAELVGMSMRMAEQTAVADRLRAEFDAYRARPWWRRLTRSAA
jgi:hypothetical protein